MSTAFPDLQVITRLTAPGAKSVKVEKFQDQATGDATIMTTVNVIYILVMLLLLLITAIGAFRLSWCYNMYVGNGQGISIFYGILAFLFNGFYYPFYALFLNPVCGMKKAAPAALSAFGGRRR
jgi:hypothetical protein